MPFLLQHPNAKGEGDMWYQREDNGLLFEVTNDVRSLETVMPRLKAKLKPFTFNNYVTVNEKVRGLLGLKVDKIPEAK